MEEFFNFFSFETWTDFSIRGLLFSFVTLLIIWLIAFILARGHFFIKHDEEMKVWFAWLAAFIIFMIYYAGYLILVATQNRGQFYYPLIFLLFFVLLGVGALRLSNKIRDKLATLKEKRSER